MINDRTPPPETAQATLRRLLDALRAQLEYQQSTGVEALPRRPENGEIVSVPRQPGAAAATDPTKIKEDTSLRQASVPETAAVTRSGPLGVRPTPPRAVPKVAAAAADLFEAPGVRNAATLGDLRGEIGDCRRCKLWTGRTQIVFGVGNPHATLMFVGEGPGRDEDLKGEPFVGRAGQLLTEIITKGMKLRREDVYIANVIKCRPPENRNPEPDEIAACQPFLQRQVEIVGPKVLVALGTFAAQTLLGMRVPISRLRGHWYEYRGIKLMPTLHPAYLLRNPNDKKLVWEDIKMVLRELEQYT